MPGRPRAISLPRLVWASAQGTGELPLLPDRHEQSSWGISTSYEGQHGYAQIAERGKAFGMHDGIVTATIPEASYAGTVAARSSTCGRTEAVLARGDGSSCACADTRRRAAANPHHQLEPDCVDLVPRRSSSNAACCRAHRSASCARPARRRLGEAAKKVRLEPQPEASSVLGVRVRRQELRRRRRIMSTMIEPDRHVRRCWDGRSPAAAAADPPDGGTGRHPSPQLARSRAQVHRRTRPGRPSPARACRRAPARGRADQPPQACRPARPYRLAKRRRQSGMSSPC